MDTSILSTISHQKQFDVLWSKTRKKVSQALTEFSMIQQGDRIMCAVSGGKDSSLMALILNEIRLKSPVNFSVHPVLLDQKQPGFSVRAYREWLQSKGLMLTVIEEDTYSVVTEKVPVGKTFCGLCSRLRRGILYNYAADRNFQKIALGHHRDDLNQTLIMNLFLNGRIASMPPKLRSDDQRNTVIRPLCNLSETDLASLAHYLKIPVIPCNLCGSQENMQRQKIKKLLHSLRDSYPDLPQSLLTAQKNLKVTQLADTNFWQHLEES